MTWIIYALLGQTFSGIAVFIDKHLAENKIKDANSLAILSALAHCIPVIPLIFWTGFPGFESFHLFLAILSGCLLTFSLFPYYWMTQRYPVSQNEFFFKFDFVFLMLLGYFFLGENLTLTDIMAAFMVFIGALVFKRSRVDQIIGNDEMTPFYILMIGLMLGRIIGNAFITKYLLAYYSELDILFYYMIGVFASAVAVLAIMPAVRQKTIQSLHDQAGIKIFWLSMLTFLYQGGRLLVFHAYALGPIALVQVIGNFKVLITIIFGGLFSLISHQTFREDISRIGMTYKIIGALIMILGLTIIAY